MKRLLAVLSLLVVAGFAEAQPVAEFYVSPSGDDARNGRSAATAWRTVDYANSRLWPKAASSESSFVVHLLPGSYTTSVHGVPGPWQSQLSNQRFFFYGNVSNPAATTFSGDFVFNASYTSLRGITINGNLSTNCDCDGTGGLRDSLADIVVNGRVDLSGLKDCTVTRMTSNGAAFTLGAGAGAAVSSRVGRRAVRDTISYNTINITMPSLPLVPTSHGFQTGRPKGAPFDTAFTVDSTLFLRNTITTLVPANGSADWSPRRHARTRNVVFSYNKWITNNALLLPGLNTEAMSVSDSSGVLTFNGEVMLANGDGESSYLFSNVGLIPASVTGISVDSSYISTATGRAMWFREGMRAASVTRSAIISGNTKALVVDSAAVGPNLVEHCTLVGNPSIGSGSHGVLSAYDGAVTYRADTTKFYSNIVYGLAAEQDMAGTGPGTDEGLSTYAGQFQNTASSFPSWLKTNWNVYGIWPRYQTPGDASLVWCCWGNGRPETATDFRGLWATTGRLNGDSLSVYGSPQFDFGRRDSVFNASGSLNWWYGTIATYGAGPDSLFNPGIGQSSIALGRAKGGLDSGVWETGAVPVATYSPNWVIIPAAPAATVTARVVIIRNIGTETLTLGTPTSSNATEATGVLGSSSLAAGASTTLTITHTVQGDGSTPTNVYIDVPTNEPGIGNIRVAVSYRYTTGEGGGGTGVIGE